MTRGASSLRAGHRRLKVHMPQSKFMSPDLKEIRRIVLNGLRGYRARVYLFGSHARGDMQRASDIDVAILPDEPLPAGLLSTIREALEESHVPANVDLVHLSESDPALRTAVLRERLPWTA